MTTDAALLADLFRRFIHDPDRAKTDQPLVNLWAGEAGGDLILDGSIGVTAEEVAALERLGVEAHQ